MAYPPEFMDASNSFAYTRNMEHQATVATEVENSRGGSVFRARPGSRRVFPKTCGDFRKNDPFQRCR
jgi:hypothetical protein